MYRSFIIIIKVSPSIAIPVIYLLQRCRVDGQFLNFDQADPSKATDFNALCAKILESKDLTPGNYAKVN